MVLAAVLVLALAVVPLTSPPAGAADHVQTESQKLLAADAFNEDFFGWAVAVDGDTAVIGARGDDDGGNFSGSAYVFGREGGTWTQEAKLVAADDASFDFFGWSVAVDGDTVVVGSMLDDDGGSSSGSAYVFSRGDGSWADQVKLTADDAAAGDNFGYRVAVDGDTVVVGAYQDDDGGNGSGAAYVFSRGDGSWADQVKLTADDAAATDQFGSAVAVDGDTVLVGAHQDDDSGFNSGSAYVFSRGDGSFADQVKLTASDAAVDDRFGWSVALNGDTAVVGARADDDDGSGSGSAYVFSRGDGSWADQVKLTADDGAAGDTFGFSVGVDGDTVVVGAYQDDDGGNGSGSAYVFSRGDGSWADQVKLVASDAATGDNFGFSADVDGTTVLVGAYQDDDGGNGSGSAYVFGLAGGTPLALATGAELADGVVGLPYSTVIVAQGGTEPYSFAVTGGALPEGLDLSTTGDLSGTPLSPGTFAFDVTVTDADETEATAGFTATMIDLDPPVITASIEPEPGAGGWYAEPITITFTCADASPVMCPAPVTLADDGPGQSVTVNATDEAGNVGSLTVEDLHIDQTDPVVTLSTDQVAYTVFDPIIVTCEATDATSGLVDLQCPAPVMSARDFLVGSHQVNATATDAAGNTATTSAAFTVDLLADVGARQSVNDLLGVLAAADPDDSHDAKRVEKALKGLARAADDSDLWDESGGLDPDEGVRVFDAVRRAVKDLGQLDDSGELLGLVGDALIELARQAAQTAIDTADLSTADDPERAQESLDDAAEHMADAEQALLDGDPERAVADFKAAFKDARKALKR